MAIDTGLKIECTDLQRTGGITRILLRSWASADEVTFSATSSATHGISLIEDGPATAQADWFMYEFKDEVPTLSVTASKENGSTAFDCVLSFYLPLMNEVKYGALQELLTQCMMGIVTDTNGNNYVIGASELYSVGGSNNASISRSQTYLNLTSMEGATGAAYSEENGITVVLTARQFELPRLYTGTITENLVAQTAVTT
tara:strand:+ start:410 stop:1009 length:600 start_codon:yes stop_codon:yes gene_type:complete